jgi:protein-tyrosine phosphatase
VAEEPDRARSVLFVCSANQCRSPMAEVLFKEMVKKKNPSNTEWHIESAGCWASIGYPATATALEAMHMRGLDLSGHRSQPVTEALLTEFDLILCMQFDHRSTLCRNYPPAAERVFLLSEMTGDKQEIWDPVGYSLDLYQAAADEITDYLTGGFEKIIQLTNP